MCACPFLGLYDDATIMLSEGTAAHRCYATKPPISPTENHQAYFCLLDDYSSCQFFLAARSTGAQKPDLTARRPALLRRTRRGTLVFWAAVMAAVLILVAAIGGQENWPMWPHAIPGTAERAFRRAANSTLMPLPSATRLERPTASLVLSDAPASSAGITAERTGVQPPPDRAKFVVFSPTRTSSLSTNQLFLAPKIGNAGWWDNESPVQRGLNDSFLYVGSTGGRIYISAARFDLEELPRGALLTAGSLTLTGVADSRLDPTLDSTWLVQVISEQQLGSLVGTDFLALYSAPSSITLFPELQTGDLQKDGKNVWNFDDSTLRWVEQERINGAKSVTVRIVAATGSDQDTLFGWDSGLGLKTENNGPQLLLEYAPPPATPPPFPTTRFVVATATPVPENVLTVVALQGTATTVAQTTGTYTPLPYFITPTPFPQNLETVQARALALGLPVVVLETPVALDAATETAVAEYATAVALTTGTFTPVPTGFVTPFVVVPSPLAENSLTAVARTTQAAQAELTASETATSLPWNAVIGEFVVATPLPENVATAAALSIQQTASVQLLGPPTATPFQWIVITPTPVPQPTATATLPVLLPQKAFTATPIPTATEVTPDSLPDEFRNLVFFKTNRGSGEETWFYAPASGESGKITRDWVYPLAQKQLALSPDVNHAVIVKRDSNNIAQLFIRSFEYGSEKQITNFGRDSYDPAWSPKGDWIAFVSTNSGNDEIYRISPDGSVVEQLTSNQWEWDKHPTWSPDGQQIVFFSNRDSGRRQLWTMNADGSNPQPFLISAYEDYYPIWAR